MAKEVGNFGLCCNKISSQTNRTCSLLFGLGLQHSQFAFSDAIVHKLSSIVFVYSICAVLVHCKYKGYWVCSADVICYTTVNISQSLAIAW